MTRPAPGPAPGSSPGSASGPPPGARNAWRIGLGLAWLAVTGWIVVTRADELRAGHPAYAVLVALAGLVGITLLLTGLRRRTRSAGRPGWRLVGRIAALLASAAVLGALAWLRPLPPDDVALAAMAGSEDVAVADETTRITLTPREGSPRTGLVFQPGALVDPRAYAALLTRVAAEGYLVVIVKQPLNIGFAALGAPDGVLADHPDIEHWALAGHSLGGVAASAYAEEHPDDVDGLVLWASYPLSSLAGRDDLDVTSVSATEDALATPQDIEDSRADLPADTTYVAVEGAVHAFFGDYGEQRGDGRPTVPREQAQDEIVGATTEALARLAEPSGRVAPAAPSPAG